MLKDTIYNKVLRFYNILSPKNTFICYKCMEKALGRKIRKRDLVDVRYPFNDEFREWYVFGR